MSLRRWGGLARDALLAIGALIGLATVGWLIFSQVTGSTLITVRTGSMSPAIPQDSLLVARPIPVDQARVGDVVTTRLDDASPLITHRVVQVRDDGGGRELILQGDANDTPDLHPYRVERVLLTQWSLPGGAHAIYALSSPAGAATVAAVVGALVGWALWPSRRAPTRRRVEAR